MREQERTTNTEAGAMLDGMLDDAAADLALQAIRELGHAIDREEFSRWLVRRFDTIPPGTRISGYFR